MDWILCLCLCLCLCECAGFLIMPKRPYEWRVDTHGCYTYDNSALGFVDHVTKRLTFRWFSTFAPPTYLAPDSIMRSEHAQQRRIERRHNKQERVRRLRT